MTNTGWVIIAVGGAALLFGVFAVVMAFRTRTRLMAMEATRTIPAREASQIADPTGNVTVELYGVSETSQPLVSPVTGTPCVYYRHKVEELYEDRHTDANGVSTHDESWRTVSDEEHHAPFWLRDASGAVAVLPKQAEFVADKSVDDAFMPYQSTSTGSMLGDVLHDVLDTSGATGQRRQSEWIIRTGFPVYVLGSAVATQSGPCVQKGAGPLIVSYKSEEELGHSFKWRFAGWLIAGLVCSGGGIVAIAYAIGTKQA